MAQHKAFNDQLPHGRRLRSALNKMDEGVAEFNEVLDIMETMKDGDAVGNYLQTKFGFADLKAAGDAYTQLTELRAKFAPILADMVAAFRQFG